MRIRQGSFKAFVVVIQHGNGRFGGVAGNGRFPQRVAASHGGPQTVANCFIGISAGKMSSVTVSPVLTSWPVRFAFFSRFRVSRPVTIIHPGPMRSFHLPQATRQRIDGKPSERGPQLGKSAIRQMSAPVSLRGARIAI